MRLDAYAIENITGDDIMIYSQATGGFGNQLYNYAIGYALAKKYNDNFTLDISPYKFSPRPFVLNQLSISGRVEAIFPPLKDNRIFRMFARACRIIATNKYGACRWIKEKPESRNVYYDYDFSHKWSLYLEGYWQNYRYFDEYYQELCMEFQPKEGILSDICKELIEQCQNENSIAIHIRRGDYEDAWLLNENYYATAIDIINKEVEKPHFYFFCEDIDYIRQQYSNLKNSVFVTSDYQFTDIEEFFVLSACKHQIIANSTYSWWAAYLNQNPHKIVIAPEYKHWTKEYYPPKWNVI